MQHSRSEPFSLATLSSEEGSASIPAAGGAGGGAPTPAPAGGAASSHAALPDVELRLMGSHSERAHRNFRGSLPAPIPRLTVEIPRLPQLPPGEDYQKLESDILSLDFQSAQSVTEAVRALKLQLSEVNELCEKITAEEDLAQGLIFYQEALSLYNGYNQLLRKKQKENNKNFKAILEKLERLIQANNTTPDKYKKWRIAAKLRYGRSLLPYEAALEKSFEKLLLAAKSQLERLLSVIPRTNAASLERLQKIYEAYQKYTQAPTDLHSKFDRLLQELQALKENITKAFEETEKRLAEAPPSARRTSGTGFRGLFSVLLHPSRSESNGGAAASSPRH